jgi:rhodanese-related sulfurtransferase
MPPDPVAPAVAERRSTLLAATLRALVTERWAVGADARTGSFPSGAALVDPDSDRAWVLVEGDAGRRLGGALAVALRAGVGELHLVVDDPVSAGMVARRASAFRRPATVWRSQGRELDAVSPASPAQDPPPHPGAELYRPVLHRAGLEVVVEGGQLVGELLGLEVARVVVDDEGSAHVEAGVGRFDREAGAMMFADLGETDSVARAADIVRRYRVAGAERHPLNQLVPERWLRSVVVAHPGLVGAATLRAVGSARPRRNLTEDGVAAAVGVDPDDRPVVVVCSTGVDLDLVPSAVDDRLTHDPEARLLLAVPERDRVPITQDLAALAVGDVEIVTVADRWRDLGGGDR